MPENREFCSHFMEPIQNIFPRLTHAVNVVITMHQKPDADAMGSALGLYHFLHQLGHTVTVISPTNWAAFLDWMPGCEAVLDHYSNREKGDALVMKADWVFCLDFNALHRTRQMEAVLEKTPATRVLIDHHEQPQVEFFQYGISDTSKSSTAEMVYDFIAASGHENLMNTDIAACLYAGIMTDTGSFRFASTSASVHRAVAELKSQGLNHTFIHEAIYDNYLENRLRFIGHVLLHRMEVLYEYNTALIAIPLSDLKRFHITTGDTEGLVNYPLSIQGMKMAALIVDREEEIKCSFRSKGAVDVNTFARTYFEGGGHFNAAGGKSSTTLEETVARFKEAIKEHTALLQ
jgi:bifunctional oligoribonuclease and PAP phosphatase NrnA